MPRHCVKLHKRSLIQKHVNTLTRRLLPARMLFFDGCLTAGVNGLLAPGKEIGEFTGCGAQVKFLLSLLRHVFLNSGGAQRGLLRFWVCAQAQQAHPSYGEPYLTTIV